MKKGLALSLVFVLMFSIAVGCGNQKSEETDSDLAYVQSKGTLFVGVTDFAPMTYRNENGEWIGFDVEFARAFAEKIGVTAKFIEISPDKTLEALHTKSIDCIWSGTVITDDLRTGTSVTDAYARNAQVVVMTDDKLADYPDVESLVGLQFAVEADSAGARVVRENGLTAIVVNTPTDALTAVVSGTADACILDLTTANALTGESADYAGYGYSIELSPEVYGVSFRIGSDLTTQFNAVLAEFRIDGTLRTLTEKYNLSSP